QARVVGHQPEITREGSVQCVARDDATQQRNRNEIRAPQPSDRFGGVRIDISLACTDVEHDDARKPSEGTTKVAQPGERCERVRNDLSRWAWFIVALHEPTLDRAADRTASSADARRPTRHRSLGARSGRGDGRSRYCISP